MKSGDAPALNHLYERPALGSGDLISAELGECFTLLRKALEERSGLPDFAVLTLEFGDALINLFEADGVGVPHRAAAMRGKSVAVDINNVDIRSAQRVAFLENARALIDQRVEATVRNFLGGDLTLRNAGFCDPFGDKLSHKRIRSRAALVVVLVPTSAGFLAVPAELAKAIFRKRLANAGNFQVAIFFTDAPANVEAREIASGEWAHGHAKIRKGAVHGFDACAFFDEELGFAAVGAKHAIADKTAAVAYEHSHFAERFRKLHARGDHFFRGSLAADNLQKAHDIRGAEEMRSDDGRRTRGGRSNLINA